MKVKRFLLATAGLVFVSALAPAAASAATIELGATPTAITQPTCPKGVAPKSCTIILTQATGLETIRDGVDYPTTVKKDGVIVAWTAGLAQLSSSRTAERGFIHILDMNYGGVPQAAIVVLKSGAKRRWTVVASSPVQHLIQFLGMVVQFPLAAPIPVTRGEVIGLSVPTWAPVLEYKLPVKKFAYRQSRMANCANAANSQQVQIKTGDNARYLCNYPGTRVEYSATEIPTPVAPKNYVH
ncbi:MAG: hypothetical protein ACR2QA_15840 [Solirubrobacteraceae bacterium]